MCVTAGETAVDWRRGLVDTLLNGSMPYSRGRTGEQVQFLPNQIGAAESFSVVAPCNCGGRIYTRSAVKRR